MAGALYFLTFPDGTAASGFADASGFISIPDLAVGLSVQITLLQLDGDGVPVRQGSGTVTLVAGTNPVTITLNPIE